MNALEKVIDLLVAVCLMFLLPLLYYSGVSAGEKTAIVAEAGEMFLKRISTAGEISEGVLLQLERELWECGCEEYELVRLRTLYEPTDDMEVQKCEYVADKNTLRARIEEDGTVGLLQGDKIWLTVYVNDIPAVYFTTIRSGEAQG